MNDFVARIIVILLMVAMIVWVLVALLGGAEILWWIFTVFTVFTGDFFHFVSETAVSVW